MFAWTCSPWPGSKAFIADALWPIWCGDALGWGRIAAAIICCCGDGTWPELVAWPIERLNIINSSGDKCWRTSGNLRRFWGPAMPTGRDASDWTLPGIRAAAATAACCCRCCCCMCIPRGMASCWGVVRGRACKAWPELLTGAKRQQKSRKTRLVNTPSRGISQKTA